MMDEDLRRLREFFETSVAFPRLATVVVATGIYTLFGGLRAGTGPRIPCTAQLTHRTRRTALAEARIHDGDTLIALGTASFHIIEG